MIPLLIHWADRQVYDHSQDEGSVSDRQAYWSGWVGGACTSIHIHRPGGVGVLGCWGVGDLGSCLMQLTEEGVKCLFGIETECLAMLE